MDTQIVDESYTMDTLINDSAFNDVIPSIFAETEIASQDRVIETKDHREEVLEPSAYEGFRNHRDDWIPKLDGVRQTAMRKNIIENGQLAPILVDEKNYIWDGRARFAILKDLRKTVRILRIQSVQGMVYALAGNTNRDKTVLDDAMLVKWVGEKGLELIKLSGTPKEKTDNAKVSLWLIENQGWQRRESPRTIASYIKLAKELENASKEQRKKVVESATVTAALSVFKAPKSVLEPSEKACRKIKAMVKALQGVGDHCRDEPVRVELEKAKQALDGLLKLSSAA